MDQTIARIAEQLGFQAARIWPQVVMVTWMTSLFWTVVEVIGVLASLGTIFIVVRHVFARLDKSNAKGEDVRTISDEYDDNVDLLLSTAICIIMAVLAALMLGNLPSSLAGVLYPEAVTVMNLAKGLKG